MEYESLYEINIKLAHFVKEKFFNWQKSIKYYYLDKISKLIHFQLKIINIFLKKYKNILINKRNFIKKILKWFYLLNKELIYNSNDSI